MKISFTRRARRDLDEILAYTEERWGQQQRYDYQDRVRKRLDSLLANPDLGVSVEDFSSSLRGLHIEKHVAYYRVSGDVIEIVRVLHERADAAQQFGE